MHPFQAEIVHERLLIIVVRRKRQWCNLERENHRSLRPFDPRLEIGSMQRIHGEVGVYDEWITREDIGKG